MFGENFVSHLWHTCIFLSLFHVIFFYHLYLIIFVRALIKSLCENNNISSYIKMKAPVPFRIAVK